MNRYANVDETKYMSFLIKDDQLLKQILKSGIKSAFVLNEPVYNKKHFKNKIHFYEGKTNTNFHDNGMLKKVSHCICLSVILTDSVFKMGENYYTPVFLE